MRQSEGLESTDSTLTQASHPRYFKIGQSRANVRLSDPEFDPPLLEALGERLQLPRIGLAVYTAAQGGVRPKTVGVHVHTLVVMLHVVYGRHVRMRVGSAGTNVSARHASDGDARGEVLEQVALQALCRLVMGMMVVMRGQHGRVMKVPRGGRGCAGHARHGGHGVVSGIWFVRMALLSDDVHGC